MQGVHTWVAVAIVLGLAGCGDTAAPMGSSASGGSGGVGGFAGQAGTGGVGGSAGDVGTGGTGAIGGNAGLGGVSGAAGTGGFGGAGAGDGGDAGVGGDAGASGDAGGGGEGGGEPSTGPFAPVSDFALAGPYGSTTLANVGPNNGYTVYLPMQLSPNGARHPIVGWMSGGATTHTAYALLPHLASHGFVVVAANVVPNIGQEAMLGTQIMAGIDWAIAENARMGSALYDKLDVTKLASAGYSMGSLSTFMIANDPRLTTTLHISGGNMAPERVQNLHAPAAFICGTPGPASCNILDSTCDIAAANCDTDFMNADTPVFYANFSGGHLGILSPGISERISAMGTAWLRFQLMGDTTLSTMFIGPSCSYCNDSSWKVQQKNL